MLNEWKILKAAAFTSFVFSLLGWLYIVAVRFFHPATLTIQLTHLTPWIREDTFGILCFIISFISFFVWNVARQA